jgi:hypothetical protein
LLPKFSTPTGVEFRFGNIRARVQDSAYVSFSAKVASGSEIENALLEMAAVAARELL